MHDKSNFVAVKYRKIDLCPLRRVLDHNFTVFIDYVCSANPTRKKNKRKSKTLFKK